LLGVVAALCPPTGFASGVDRGQQQPNENTDNCYDYKQLNQGKAGAISLATNATATQPQTHEDSAQHGISPLVNNRAAHPTRSILQPLALQKNQYLTKFRVQNEPFKSNALTHICTRHPSGMKEDVTA
jgi:hypothetical protein